MNVLQIVEPGYGGVFRHVEGLVLFLIQNGVSVDLAYSSVRDSQRLWQLIETVERSGGNTFDLGVAANPSVLDFKALYQVVKHLRRMRVDIVHCHSSKGGVLGRISSLVQKNKGCFYTPNAYYGQGGGGFISSVLYENIERIAGKIGYTINVSDEERRYAVQELGVRPCKQFLIFNGVDFEEFFPTSETRKCVARKKLGIPKHAIVIGSVGRLEKQKDPECLIKVFGQIKTMEPTAYFLHLGEGSMEARIKQLVSQNSLQDCYARIAGLSDVREFYDALDGFMLTSEYEGLPFSVIEAFAYNLPVALTSCPGCVDFNTFGFNQLWYGDVGDRKSMRDAGLRMFHWIKSQELSGNRDIAYKHFDRNASYKLILEKYEQSIAEDT